MLSKRIRANLRTAPWVIEEVERLEAELSSLKSRIASLEAQLKVSHARGDLWEIRANNAMDRLENLLDYQEEKFRMGQRGE